MPTLTAMRGVIRLENPIWINELGASRPSVSRLWCPFGDARPCTSPVAPKRHKLLHENATCSALTRLQTLPIVQLSGHTVSLGQKHRSIHRDFQHKENFAKRGFSGWEDSRKRVFKRNPAHLGCLGVAPGRYNCPDWGQERREGIEGPRQPSLCSDHQDSGGFGSSTVKSPA